MKILFLALLAALAAPAAPPPRLSESEAAAVRQAEERGATIYAYDQAAWHGTDDLAARMPDFATRVGGWIVDGPADAPEIVFFDKSDPDPQPLYVADFRDNHLVTSRLLGPADDRSLSPQRKAMVAALRAARAALPRSDFKACKSSAFNSVVLPPARPGDPILVYFLTPQTSNDAVPFGGHYLFEVGTDGKAHPKRRFTNSCLEMPLRPPGGAQSEGIFVTHLLDPVPTEIHVFTSLTARTPVFVGTTSNSRMWEVDGKQIRPVSANIGK